MSTLKKVEWNAEKIASLAVDAVKSLRKNAMRLGELEIVKLCDSELKGRSPRTNVVTRVKGVAPAHKGKSVVGFHFVCDREKGVTNNSDGTFWTGTWVVDEQHAERSLKISAYIALHATKSESSYMGCCRFG